MIKHSCVRYTRVTVALGAFALAVVSSCSFGLQPLSSKSDTFVSLRIAGIDLPDGARSGDRQANRAIVQGTGYLYVRTFGGPKGDAGPLYGPYTVSPDATFKTADIPPGTYSEIALVYSAKPFGETPRIEWKGASYSFKEAMSLPDAVFMDLADNDGALFDPLFDGEASTGMTGAVTVREGKTTTLSATLVPTAGMGYFLNAAVTTPQTLPAQASMVRKFFGISGLGATLTASEFEASISFAPGKTAPTLGIVALYAADGTIIKNFGSVGTLTEAKTLTTTVGKADYYFLYIEYQAAEALAIGFTAAVKKAPTEPVTPTEPPLNASTMTVNFIGTESLQEKTLYYCVYDLASLSVITPEEASTLILKAKGFGETAGTPCGYGAIELDGNGTGSGVARGFSGTPLAVSSTGMYLVCAFVDVDERYSDIIKPETLMDAKTVSRLVPRIGDYSTDTMIYWPTIHGPSLNVQYADMVENLDYVYFVDGIHNGSGLTFDDPASYSLIEQDYFSNASVSDTVIMYLVDSLDVSNPITIGGPRVLAGAPGTDTPTITYTGTGTFISSGSMNQPLILHDITITGDGSTLTGSLISIEDDTLTLGDKCTLTGFKFQKDSVQGGAIYANSCYITMLGSATIDSMVVVYDPSVTSEGGAVYLNNSRLTMYGQSKLSGCTGWYRGGGVFATLNGSMVSMNDASTIHFCAAVLGGGVYSDRASVNLIGAGVSPGIIIDDCRASKCGGGMLLDNLTESQLILSDNVSITLNTADISGGGVFYTPTNLFGWETDYASFVVNNTAGGNFASGSIP